MRLIDADALSHKFFEIGCHITKIHPMDVMNIISEQPTTYDVEKVTTQIEEMFGVDAMYYGTEAKWAVDKSIEIVKRGGINE